MNVIGNGSNIQIRKIADKFFDDLLLFRWFFLIFLINTNVDQKVGKTAFIIRFIFYFGDVFFIFFKEQVYTEIFMEMIFQGTLKIIRQNIDYGFAFRNNFRIDDF